MKVLISLLFPKISSKLLSNIITNVMMMSLLIEKNFLIWIMLYIFFNVFQFNSLKSKLVETIQFNLLSVIHDHCGK